MPYRTLIAVPRRGPGAKLFAAGWRRWPCSSHSNSQPSTTSSILPATAYTIAVVGKGPLKFDPLIPNVPSSTLGASFFAWNEGNDGRITAFLNFLSSAKFALAEPERIEKAYELSETMPSWPELGSIARVGEVV
jgi:hypothetical protein